MAFFTRKDDTALGRLYVFRLGLRTGKTVWKVGITNSDRSLDRMMEVLRSFFSVYRYVPETELRRDKALQLPHLVEKHLHNLLKEEGLHYPLDSKVSGYTEFFTGIDEKELLDYIDNFDYIELLRGKKEMPTKDLEAIRKVLEVPLPEGELPF